MGITVGIDLGTTNSVVCIKKIKVSAIRNVEGDELTPSVVTAVPRNESGEFDFIVGRHSREMLKQYPEQTITSVKRLMGRDFDDVEVQNMIKDGGIGYSITTDASEPGSIRIPLGGKMQTPEMISGIILSKLIRDGECELKGNKIDQAVVTVPAYFSDRQKFATRAACDYAGIKLLRLLPEPTAAALSFGLDEQQVNESQTVMVFDLGGGTFDISVLSFVGGSFMEVTKGGDMWLGGDNIDKLLVDYVFSQVEKNAHCKPILELLEQLSSVDKARFLVEIKEKAEFAKIELSTTDLATIEMFGILKDENNNLIDIDVSITREQFDNLLQPIVNRVSDIAEQILHEIRFEPNLIDTVLMVGGSSLVPAIQEQLKSMFGADKVMVHPRPMLAIAEGAALMASKINSKDDVDNESFTLMHSTAHDYYLQLADGKRHLLVARNTPLPFSVEQPFSFAQEYQYLARLRVFNEVDGVLDTVGELWFHKNSGIDFTQRGDNSKLMLRFSVDEDNIICMKAWSVKNEQQCVETQIARGGLSAKLYNDLEHTLSSIISTCNSKGVEVDVQQLSNNIVNTILSATNPISGETVVEQKQKAVSQINLLKELKQNNVAPLSIYNFALLAYNSSLNVISQQNSLKLSNILDKFRAAIDDLNNITEFQTLEKEVHELYDEIPLLKDLARAENAATLLDGFNPGDAKQVRKQAKKLSNLYIEKNYQLIDDARDLLHEMLHRNLSWSSSPSRRFDRDIQL